MSIGMVVMRPTSIVVAGTGSSASIRADGGVTFSSATSLSLNEVFTSSYDNYMVVLRGQEAASNNIALRVRSAGTDAIGTNYVYQQLFGNGTSVSGARFSAQSSAWTGYLSAAQRSGNTIYIYGPALAQPTAGRNISGAGLSDAASIDYAWTHSLSTSYDGITFLGMSSMSGVVTVYGYTQ